MIKHYFTVALRLIKRGFLFSSINILGFVFGITAAFLIYLWVVDELTFEDFQKNRNNIYRVISVSKNAAGEIKESAELVGALSEAFRTEFPQVENATFIKYDSKHPFSYNNKVIEAKTAYVDTTFFDVFSFPVVEGNPLLMKENAHAIVISDEVARKLFGKEPAVGKELKSEFFSQTYYYSIVAVVQMPRKSHIQFEVAFNKNNFFLPLDWRFSEWIHVYVQMKDNYSLSYNSQKAMSELYKKHTGFNELLAFQPLTDIHLKTRFHDTFVTNYGSMQQIYLFIALSILVVFMGAFNFMTLTTARASLRYKEIGVRKVTGAKRKTLISQFLSESMVQAFLSLVLALALTELMLPLFNKMMHKDISLQFSWQVLLFIVLGIFGVGCLAGSYPAFYLSSINPLLAFKGGQKTGKKGTFIRGLVCLQFIIAIALILCTFIVFKQLNYINNKDLGLDKEDIIIVESNLWYDVGEFKQEVLKNPRVKSVSMGAHIASLLNKFSNKNNIENITWHTTTGQIDSLSIVPIWADGDFISTYGLTLLTGSIIDDDYDAYWNQTYEFPLLLNEAAWKRMKVDNPIGMQLQDKNGKYIGKVVGVVKDFNFESLREGVKPMMMRYSPEAIIWLHIKIAHDNKQETLRFLKEKYETMRPDRVFTYQFFSDALRENYARETQQSRMFLIFTILAIIIAMMGVFGLVALSTQQRTKEIGVRKVIGAHADRIVKMFCLEYLKWLGIAFVIACPLGYLFMIRWLSNFAYQTPISWWLFPLAGLIILAITMGTVVLQTYRTASQNPVNSLRYE